MRHRRLFHFRQTITRDRTPFEISCADNVRKLLKIIGNTRIHTCICICKCKTSIILIISIRQMCSYNQNRLEFCRELRIVKVKLIQN